MTSPAGVGVSVGMAYALLVSVSKTEGVVGTDWNTGTKEMPGLMNSCNTGLHIGMSLGGVVMAGRPGKSNTKKVNINELRLILSI